MSERVGDADMPQRKLFGNFMQMLSRGMMGPAHAPPQRKVPRANPDRPKLSKYIAPDEDVADRGLAERPDEAPSILEELQHPVRLLICQSQSPGDIIMLSAAIRDLHRSYPGKFQTGLFLSKGNQALFKHNPYITAMGRNEPEVNKLYAHYPLQQHSNSLPYHFVHGFRMDFQRRLGLPIDCTAFKGDIHLSEEEWAQPPFKEVANIPYWIIDAGCKKDYTNKLWDHQRFQRVVNAFPNTLFVQIGSSQRNHMHKPLEGQNLLNLVGKTTLRQLVQLTAHAFGVITPVSLPMHLSAAIPMHRKYVKDGGYAERPCIVIAGGREPVHWEAYPSHTFLHTVGRLPCCAHGGCWKSRVQKLYDGWKQDESLCEDTVAVSDGQIIPACLDRISADQVIQCVLDYKRVFHA